MPNTNPKYLEYKALLDSNPNIKIFLDTISKAEGTWGPDAYSMKFGGGVKDYSKGKDRSIVKSGNSSAHGKYQIMNDTYDRWSKELGITGFTPEEQDIIALAEMEEAGALPYAKEGDFRNAIFKASSKWMGLPKSETSTNNNGQKSRSFEQVMEYTKSNESQRAAVNKTYEDLNNRRANSKDKKVQEQNRKDFERYQKEIKAIAYKEGLSDQEKNQLKHEVKKKYYRDGSLLSINTFLQKDVDKKTAFANKLERNGAGPGIVDLNDNSYASNKIKTGINHKGTIFDPVPDEAKSMSYKEFEKLRKEGLALGIDIGKYSQDINSGKLGKLAGQIKKGLLGPMPEPGIKKYGQTKQEFDERVMATAPKVSSSTTDSKTETATVSPDGTVSTEADTKAKAEADAKAKKEQQIQARKNFDPTDLMNKFDTEYADPKFKYTPGKQQIPFDAVIGLASGIMGMEAADVDIKYRDEKISEGLMLYAQDLERIKRIGLPPEIEADLNMKISGAYQTGIENIVRASGGNRNLVLGNQGQVENARMNSLVQVSAMDIERRDKAMAAFGELQQYINEFDSRRDIANNERQYNEDQKQQMAGMQLAQSGMASFIDSLNYQRDNGPGSANDMMRQYFEFSTTGILKGAAPGEIGSPEYFAQKKIENDVLIKNKNEYAQFTRTKNAEEQNLIAEILKKHPELDPTVNPQANVNDLKKYYDEFSGDAEKKEAFYEGKDISSLATMQAQKKTEEADAALKGQPSPEVKTTSMNANGSVNVASGEMPIEQQKYTPKQSPSETVSNAVNQGISYPAVSKDALAKKFVGTDPNVPDVLKNAPKGYIVNSKGELVPSGSTGAIVTKDKLPDDILLDTLNKNKDGANVSSKDLSKKDIDRAVLNEIISKQRKPNEEVLKGLNEYKASASKAIQQEYNKQVSDLSTNQKLANYVGSPYYTSDIDKITSSAIEATNQILKTR